MNKLTKVGCSALCGSLAAISAANAGDLTVTGGADLTWVSLTSAVTGNPIGMGSNYSLKGSGELDNGWTFDYTVANTNANAYSSSAIALSMGGLGKLNFNSGDSGNGIQAYDDKMPTAWEEAWGAGLGTGVMLVDGVGPSMNIQYTTPKFAGLEVAVAWAPKVGITDTADKSGSGDSANGTGAGYDMTINFNPDTGTEILTGLNVFVGAHYTDHYDGHTLEQDAYEGVTGITFDMGPVSLGMQTSANYTGNETGTSDYNTYKNHAYGIAFNISDDLSMSYGKMESRQAGYNDSLAQTNGPARTIIVQSFQVAYTVGGASVRVAEVTADNTFHSTSSSADAEATIISLGLAF